VDLHDGRKTHKAGILFHYLKKVRSPTPSLLFLMSSQFNTLSAFFLLSLQFNRSDVSSFCPYSLRLSKLATFSVFPRPSPLVGRSSSPASALPHRATAMPLHHPSINFGSTTPNLSSAPGSLRFVPLPACVPGQPQMSPVRPPPLQPVPPPSTTVAHLPRRYRPQVVLPSELPRKVLAWIEMLVAWWCADV
jgi:hypothetical protein